MYIKNIKYYKMEKLSVTECDENSNCENTQENPEALDLFSVDVEFEIIDDVLHHYRVPYFRLVEESIIKP